MADSAVINDKARAGGKRKNLAEKLAEESSKIIGDLKASSGRQTRNAAKGIVYKPPVKKPRAPRDPNAPKRGKPAKEKEAAKEEAPADDKKEEAEADA